MSPMELMRAGHFARSKAGHDKDSLMVILREDGTYVYLADGKSRSVEAPKRKKKKHVHPIRQTLTGEGPWTNEQIKEAIKVYMKEDLNV